MGLPMARRIDWSAIAGYMVPAAICTSWASAARCNALVTGSRILPPNASPWAGPCHGGGAYLERRSQDLSAGKPDYAAGVRFNLYSNKWGTNFPMWWEGSVMFRFVVELAR